MIKISGCTTHQTYPRVRGRVLYTGTTPYFHSTRPRTPLANSARDRIELTHGAGGGGQAAAATPAAASHRSRAWRAAKGSPRGSRSPGTGAWWSWTRATLRRRSPPLISSSWTSTPPGAATANASPRRYPIISPALSFHYATRDPPPPMFGRNLLL